VGGAALLGLAAHAGTPAQGEGRADYDIRARLEGPTKTITGRETISWTNGSGEEVRDAWFHLYLNAFSNNRSTHLQEAKGKLRDHAVEDGWGWSRVTSIEAVDRGTGTRHDLLPSFRYRRPDDGNEEDRTVFSVDLPAPVRPGGELTLEVGWEAQLPRVRRRTGYKDDFLLVAQWFPKLGVYEAGRGWNCHQFHMNTEFYADYGTYRVTLDLPPEYHGKVFGSGRKEYDELERGRDIVRFVAPYTYDQTRLDAFGKTPLVHDFAWTASPRFVVKTATFEPSRWIEEFPDEVARARAALGEEALNLRPVDVTTLIQPEHAGQEERHRRAAEAALFFYGLWFGEYPYAHLTVIDPAWGAGAAGGMEYPTLFTAGTELYTTPDMHTPEGVTVHECGHQFWYGLVGNNEFEAAWLDEGFNSYTDSEVLSIVYGARRDTTEYAKLPFDGVPVTGFEPEGRLGRLLALRKIPAPFGLAVEPLSNSGFVSLWRDQPALTFTPGRTDPRWADRTGYLADRGNDPIDTAAYQHVDRASYRANSYQRTAVALRTLQYVVGDAPFLRGMRHYAKEWRYRHPYPDDFFRSFQEGAGVDCAWLFEDLFRSRATGDWSVEVESRRRPRDLGLFQGEGGDFLEPATLETEEGEDDRPWQLELVLRRKGDLSLDVPLRLTFDDGTTRDELWTRAEQLERAWKRLTFESQTKLISAELDPEGRIFLDGDRSNDAWYDAREPLTAWRYGERVQVSLQHYLHFLGGIGG
jgi:aminopeptidase N